MTKEAVDLFRGGVPPPVFCERVRKRLIGKELPEWASLKSAEECENNGVNFLDFPQGSERVRSAETTRLEKEVNLSDAQGRSW